MIREFADIREVLLLMPLLQVLRGLDVVVVR